MTTLDPGYIGLEDLYVAYRKAKVDAFYERDHATALEFAEYEIRLAKNLRHLWYRLTEASPDWPNDIDLVGTYAFIPKAIEPKAESKRNKPAIISDPDAAWTAQCTPLRADATFRIVGRHPVDFHIISALWIQKVGHLFDSVLASCAYANRVRRTVVANDRYYPPCKSTLGTFRPYSFGFRSWRANGLTAMRDALKAEKPIIAITADLRSFYHRTSPRYLLNPRFLESYGLRLNANQLKFTEQFVSALETWARNTPEHANKPSVGLPVGLSAPRLIANVIMHEFDRFVTRELSPIYYGRYVDDVFLVLENTREFATSDDVWNFVMARSEKLVTPTQESDGPGYRIILSYSPESDLVFVGKKQKVFVLEGTSGSSLLEAVMHAITRRSSDWRLLPDLPTDEEDLAAEFLNAGRDAAEEVDNLRKADGITVQRLGFALRLRNFEAVRRDLLPHQWKEHREKLYRIVLDHIITAQGIFAYSPYVARLLSLAVACGDFERAAQFVRRIVKVFELIGRTAEVHEIELNSAQETVLVSCFQAAVKGLASFSRAFSDSENHGIQIVLNAFADAGIGAYSRHQVERWALMLLQSDLGIDAYRERWIDGKPDNNQRKEPLISAQASVREELHLDDARQFLIEANFPPHCAPRLRKSGKAVPRALAFPTRPFTTAEISLLDQLCLSDWQRFRTWVTALRGREFSEEELARTSPTKNGMEGPAPTESGGATDVVFVPRKLAPKKPIIAVPAFATNHASWKASVMGLPDPDGERYFRINRLINDALKARPQPHYFVLPELSMPRKWFNLAAHRLEHSGISLVAGLEYEHWAPIGYGSALPFVSNQVRAALVSDILGFSSLLFYQQEKERPAPEEAGELWQVAKKTLKARNPIVRSVIQHENFHFGLLICSELTNIHLRANFRGLVDALLVPEWNKDINSFSSLVEAAALDVHCFVVQINNRYFGDCRVRAPYKAEHLRDLARIKGGKADYYVLAELDVPALRAFQSMALAPTEPEFKPKPDGYEINPRRVELGEE